MVISEMDHRQPDAGELSGFVDKCDGPKGCPA